MVFEWDENSQAYLNQTNLGFHFVLKGGLFQHTTLHVSFFWHADLTFKLGSCGPGKLTEKGEFPKVLRGGCKRSFGPREQRSPKGLLHRCNPILHRCKSSFGGWCKRPFGDLCSLGPKDLLHPPLSTFGNSPFSVNFPGPQLPNFCSGNGRCFFMHSLFGRLLRIRIPIRPPPQMSDNIRSDSGWTKKILGKETKA